MVYYLAAVPAGSLSSPEPRHGNNKNPELGNSSLTLCCGGKKSEFRYKYIQFAVFLRRDDRENYACIYFKTCYIQNQICCLTCAMNLWESINIVRLFCRLFARVSSTDVCECRSDTEKRRSSAAFHPCGGRRGKLGCWHRVAALSHSCHNTRPCKHQQITRISVSVTAIVCHLG